MNAELLQKALEKVGSPHILINIVSRRVRQLNAGGRPLMRDTGTLGMADIALREIVEEKMGWIVPELEEVTRPVNRKRGSKPGARLLRTGAPQVITAAAA